MKQKEEDQMALAHGRPTSTVKETKVVGLMVAMFNTLYFVVFHVKFKIYLNSTDK